MTRSPNDPAASGIMTGASDGGEATQFDCEAHELVQAAQCIAMNIEAMPDWKLSHELITVHCHAKVLIDDLPAALSTPAADERGEATMASAVETLKLLAEWLTRVQLEGDSTEAECALLRLNCDSVADTAKRLTTPPSAAEIARLKARVAELEGALERIADERNIHFAGDAQVVARVALNRGGGE